MLWTDLLTFMQLRLSLICSRLLIPDRTIRIPMFTAYFIALSVLYCRVVVIQIIELNLNHFNLRILSQYLLQDFRPVMERNPKMPDLPFFF